MQYSRVVRKLSTTGAVITLVVMIFVAGYVMGAGHADGRVQAQNDQTTDTDDLFVPFWETWDLLHDNYVDPLDDNTLMEGALIGMMASLGDPHSSYMDPDTFARVNEGMSGEYEGIGATVQQDELTGGLELVSIFEGSPAKAAGLRSGDVIIEVDGEDITGLTESEIIALVRGPAGTVVRLGMLRPGETDLVQFDVTRDRINVSSVFSRLLENNIGYVRLSQFEFESTDALREALEELDANNLSGLILDLRNNPGGYLTTAIEVGSLFVEEGTIVIERGPGVERNYEALGGAVAPDVPMVVLVDQGSASASELIAGALQDLGRATVVGMTTFGKGSVQTWRELSNGGGVRITISRWYTPNGNSVSEIGIQPNVEIAFEPSDSEDDDNQLRAAIEVLQQADATVHEDTAVETYSGSAVEPEPAN
ncbi:MAG: S41 family peptidase [Anaerolineae bacterium]|nr:S41 family peptidase [Anaerolineae bacterium]